MYKTVHFYALKVYGLAPAGGAAPLISFHDVATTVAGLCETHGDVGGRKLLGGPGTEHEPLIMRIAENDVQSHLVTGTIGYLRARNKPELWDNDTASTEALPRGKDVHEKSHFVIDTQRNNMIFQRGQGSPGVNLLAYYLQMKVPGLVYAVDLSVHLRAGVLQKLLDADRSNQIKGFTMRVKPSALERADALGSDAKKVLEELADLSGGAAVGFYIGLEKYQRKGSIHIRTMLEGIRKFLLPSTSDEPYSDIEQLSVRIQDETINLLSQKFATRLYLPDEIFTDQYVDSTKVLELMTVEYQRRKGELT